MRRLLLARHAKSSWSDPALRDHDRPLNSRGRGAAPKIAAALRDADLLPDLVYSSTSARTRETWARMEPDLGGNAIVEFLPELYLASAGGMLAVIQSAPPGVSTLMLLGHNPGTHALAVGLAGQGDREDLLEMRAKFPTGAVAVIDFPCDAWSEIEGTGHLRAFLRPRTL